MKTLLKDGGAMGGAITDRCVGQVRWASAGTVFV